MSPLHEDIQSSISDLSPPPPPSQAILLSAAEKQGLESIDSTLKDIEPDLSGEGKGNSDMEMTTEENKDDGHEGGGGEGYEDRQEAEEGTGAIGGRESSKRNSGPVR